MESVNFTPQKEPFVFSEILQEIVKSAEFQASKKNITITCENCEDSTMIDADISMMERVVQNLLENAIKYTNENEHIKVTLSRRPGKLVVVLENSGTLIADELLMWINNSNGEGAISRPKRAGLGLALVKRILHLHQFDFAADISDYRANRFIISMNSYKKPIQKV